MYQLNKINCETYTITKEDKVLYTGNLQYIKLIAFELGLQDVDIAIDEMRKATYSTAEFGVNGYFICLINEKRLRN